MEKLLSVLHSGKENNPNEEIILGQCEACKTEIKVRASQLGNSLIEVDFKYLVEFSCDCGAVELQSTENMR